MSHKKIPLLLLALGAALSGCGGKSAAETIVQAEEVLITDAEATDEIPAGADTAGGTAADTDAAEGNPAGADTAGDTEPEAVLSGGNDTADAAGAGTDTAPEEDAEEPELPAYEVTPLKEATVMYAAASLNVRQGPSTGYEIVGSLDYGEDITVTGQADTGWYEIEYQDSRDFVSDEYVLAERPEDQNAAGILQKHGLTKPRFWWEIPVACRCRTASVRTPALGSPKPAKVINGSAKTLSPKLTAVSEKVPRS